MRTVICLPLFMVIGCYQEESEKPEDTVDRSDNTVIVTTPTLPDTTDTDTHDTAPPTPEDLDGDGYDSLESGGEDCDDTNPSVNPAALELDDDDIDNNCDTQIDECVAALSRVSGIFTATPGVTISWISGWISLEAGEDQFSDPNLLESPPPDVTAMLIDNIASFTYDRCIPDVAVWIVNAEFVDGAGNTHWMCQQSTVTGFQAFEDELDISNTISADVWNSDGACDASF